MSQRLEAPRRLGVLPVVAGGVALVVYLLSRTPNLALAHDAAWYLAAIVEGTGADLAHPHHLLYKPTAWGWLGVLRTLGGGGDPALAVAALNSVAGAVSVGFVAALLQHRGGVSPRLAAAAAAAAGLSFGLWFYSACVEVYAIPLAFLLATLYVALGPPSVPRAAAVGVLHGVAMLFHQVHVLFGVVVLAVWWRAGGGRATLRWAGSYLAAGSAVVIAGYGVALATAVRPASVSEAWVWFTLYAQGGSYVSGPSAGTLAKAVVGFTRSVVGGHFAFAIPAVQDLVARVFPGKVLTDEMFLVAGLPTWLPPLLTALAGGAGAIGTALVVRALRSRKPPPSALRTGLWTWVGVYAAFFLFWDPFNVEFWIPQATALWMLLALRLQGGASSPRRIPSWAALATVALLLAVVNGFGTVGPATDPANDAFVQRLAPLDGQIDEGDLLVVDRAHIVEHYAALRLGVETIGLAEAVGAYGASEAVRTVEAAVDQALEAGRGVAIAPDAFDPPETTRVVAGSGVVEAATDLRQRLGERVGGKGPSAYRILRPSVDS